MEVTSGNTLEQEVRFRFDDSVAECLIAINASVMESGYSGFAGVPVLGYSADHEVPSYETSQALPMKAALWGTQDFLKPKRRICQYKGCYVESRIRGF